MAWTALKAYTKIKANGVLATFYEYPSAVYSEATRETILGAAVEHEHYVLAPYVMSNADVQALGPIDGVKESQNWTIVSGYGMTFEPVVNMRILIDGETWIIKARKRHKVKTSIVAYELGLATR